MSVGPLLKAPLGRAGIPGESYGAGKYTSSAQVKGEDGLCVSSNSQ